MWVLLILDEVICDGSGEDSATVFLLRRVLLLSSILDTILRRVLE